MKTKWVHTVVLNNPSAALIIIGNELLSGQTQDANGHYLAERLYQVGIDLREVRMILDDEASIIKTVNSLRPGYDFIFTTGGIGPTHDDITALSMAKAFGVSLVSDPEAVRRLYERYPNPRAPESMMRMSYVPEGAELIDNPVSAAPGFRMENVYVLAGIPTIMQGMFETLVPRLKVGKPKKTVKILCHIVESMIAPGLRKIQQEHPQVEIGSYPKWAPNDHGVMVVAKAFDEHDLGIVREKIMKMFENLGYAAQEIY